MMYSINSNVARKTSSKSCQRLRLLGLALMQVSFTTIGRKKKGERQRRYTYALIDPKDAPLCDVQVQIPNGR